MICSERIPTDFSCQSTITKALVPAKHLKVLEPQTGVQAGTTSGGIKLPSLTRTLLLGSAFLFLITSHYVFKAVDRALTISLFGSKGIPLIDLGEASIALLLCFLILKYKRFSRRLSSAIAVSALASIGGLILFAICSPWTTHQPAAVVLLHLAGSALLSCSLYSVWMVMTCTVVERPAIYITLFATFPQLGVIGSSTWIQRLDSTIHPVTLLYTVAVGYSVGLTIVVLAMRTLSCSGGSLSEYVGLNGNETEKPFSLPRLLRDPFVRLFSLAVILQVAFTDLLRWNIYKEAERSATVHSMTQVLANFYEYSGYITLGFQLVVVPLMFATVTPRYGLIILPLAGMLASGSLLFTSGDTVVPLVIILYSSLDYTVNNCMRESLFLPLPLQTKVQSKSLISMFAAKLGVIAGSSVILISLKSGRLGWVIGAFAILAFWTWAAIKVLRLYRTYTDSPHGTQVVKAVDAFDENNPQ